MSLRATAALVLAVALMAAGCGGSGDGPSSTSTTTTEPAPPPKETRDKLPNRPKDWSRFADDRGGYALLLPRGWSAEAKGARSLIRSYDRLVAISIAPDRSQAALDTAVAAYAKNTARDLNGFKDGLKIKRTRGFDHRYDAAEVDAKGRSRDGVDQDVQVIVLRRDDVATITAVLAANAKATSSESVRLARRAIGTLRTRPPRD